jgi:hypothetical protein
LRINAFLQLFSVDAASAAQGAESSVADLCAPEGAPTGLFYAIKSVLLGMAADHVVKAENKDKRFTAKHANSR